MLFAEGCIVADPPEYRAPGQTRPVLNMYSAVPTATQALVIDAASPNLATNFTVQVRSEDAGEPLSASFFLDYQIDPNFDEGVKGETNLSLQQLAASTYDNEGRFFKYPWVPGKEIKGCHFLTLIVAHSNRFLDNDQFHLNPATADDDAALATWTVNVVRTPADAGTLVNCPSREGPTP